MNSCCVDIIVPIYNKEKLIDRCLSSIQSQTYSNIHVIMVNDGSTDSSSVICKKYSDSDARFCLFNKINGGVASARNYGLKKVVGDYIMFVDADDYIESTLVERIVDKASDSLIIMGYNAINSDGYFLNCFKPCDFSELDYGMTIKYIFDRNNFKYFTTPWAKLYKKKIITDNNIEFRNISYGEDTCFVFDYLRVVKKIEVYNDCLYNYRLEDNSLSRRVIVDIWEKLVDINEYCRLGFYEKYDEIWHYMYIRIMKVTLANSSGNIRSFIENVEIIRNDIDFKNIDINKIKSVKDIAIYVILKSKMKFLLYIIFKIYSL